ncbi:MAG: transposase [Bacillota bacterium]
MDTLAYSEELRQAYCLKEWFRCWYKASTYEIARSQLFDWYEAVTSSGIKEFLYTLKKTIRNWQTQILNYFFYRRSIRKGYVGIILPCAF